MSIVLDGTTGLAGAATGALNGTLGATTPSTVVATNVNTPNTFGFKNRIINGAMVIDQRNAGASVTLNDGIFPVDRFQGSCSTTGKLTAQRSSTVPAGFINSVVLTSSSAYSIGSGDIFAFTQKIEGFNLADLGWGAAGAATVTLSFWVRSSLTGTFGGTLQNSARDRNYPFSYTISSANTWEQKTVTIAGDTSGTWLTTSGVGIQLNFGLGVGSTYSGTAGAWAAGNIWSATGATSLVGTSGATLYITGVQLEKGSTATSFDFRDYGRELIMCQRYYTKFGAYTVYTGFGSGFCYATTTGTVYIKYTTTMRASPTISQSSCAYYTAGNFYALTTLASQYTGTDTVMLQASVASGLTVDKPCILVANNNTAAYIDFSAEL